MAIDLQSFYRRKKVLEEAERAQQKCAGILEQQKRQLKKEHDLDGIKEADAELGRLKAELEALEEEYKTEEKRIEEEFPDVLE